MKEERTKIFYYVCPNCLKSSQQMTLVDNRDVTGTALPLRYPEFPAGILGEIMECPCGTLNRWYTMMKVEDVAAAVR